MSKSAVTRRRSLFLRVGALALVTELLVFEGAFGLVSGPVGPPTVRAVARAALLGVALLSFAAWVSRHQ